MRVVIGNCINGFDLSAHAVEMLIERGFTVSTEYDADFQDNGDDREFPDHTKRYHVRRHDKEFRTDSRLIEVVEKLGDRACDEHFRLSVVEIPFATTEGWHLDDNETGYEFIREDHRTWYGPY